MLRLANYVTAASYGAGGVFGIGSDQQLVKNPQLWKTLAKVARMWKQPAREADIRSQAAREKLCPELVEQSVRIIKGNHFLMADKTYDPAQRFSRNWLYYNQQGADPESVQSRLSQSTVTLIGCGGIGNHVSYMLATSGVGKIILVDDDHIEISNLTRQVLFTEADVGLKKVDVLARELRRRYANITVEIRRMTITGEEDIKKLARSDLYVVSADYPAQLMDWVNNVCVEREQAYVNVGYINDISVVGPFYVPGETGCFRCQSIVPSFAADEEIRSDLAIINEGFKAATFSPVNGVAASYATGDVLKYLGGYGKVLSKNQRIGIHSVEARIETQSLAKNKECKVCGIQ